MTLEERITALAARHRTELPEDLRRGIVDLIWEVASLTRCDAEEAATAQEREACAGLAEAAGRRGSEAGADAEQLAYLDGREAAADDAARAIRARGERG